MAQSVPDLQSVPHAARSEQQLSAHPNPNARPIPLSKSADLPGKRDDSFVKKGKRDEGSFTKKGKKDGGALGSAAAGTEAVPVSCVFRCEHVKARSALTLAQNSTLALNLSLTLALTLTLTLTLTKTWSCTSSS